ncbi:lipoprotein-anchoring transpeptidase ErfK/SrfK [Sinorhizobium kostiense]|uniref:Lipoprotein-anchoring transpeptidase ErfK/SrfK n=1 Tax=Sinorhizobium kostiense TaxID=76747 RepID=A0ABS4R6V0_9HYPH|nr:L,D-transpeptidase [Sinorhizobium kostiense]MBP2238627.1 lipoprotein-anchoring transpeptidase ErfK/SrfK [Sinorhizobium kostiense]
MGKNHVTRRMLMLGGLALLASGCVSAERPRGSAIAARPRLDPRYRRQEVAYLGPEAPGTILVDTEQRFLYYVQGGGSAIRYGIGVGEEGRTLKGRVRVGRKAEWPSWTPTENMMQRKPHLRQYAGGVSGGLHNPLGAAALYLYRGGQDTMFRLHGTNEPWTIGQAVSSGCIRLTNDDIVDLYSRAGVGTTVMIV